MVDISSKLSTSSKRQEVIDWLKAHNYPALQVAPAQSAWKHPRVRGRPKTTCSFLAFWKASWLGKQVGMFSGKVLSFNRSNDLTSVT
jgi:hypothetical protein